MSPVIIGLNGATVPGASLEEGVRAAHRAGFTAFEPRVPLLVSAEAAGRTPQVLESLSRGLAWLPLNGVEGVFTSPRSKLGPRAREIFALAARFRVPQAILVPGAWAAGPNPSDALAELRWLGTEARHHGVEPLYELIGFPTFAFPSLDQAYDLARAAGFPLVLDTFHLAISRTRPDEVARLPASAIGLVHLSDAITAGKGLEELRDEDRVLPGEGGLPLKDLLDGIRRTGYSGPVSVEVFHPKYGERDPAAVARDAFRTARDLLTAAGWEL
ncbi:MAG: sugar phosphate isomerase/epimerase [Candidatus Bipolaricaulota bacterium]